MSDMDDFVDVTVTRRGKQISTGCYKMPVTIGRGEHNSVRIGHAPQDKTISRTHALIQRAGKGLQLIDKSANGTIYLGERIRQTVELRSPDHFEIFEFKVNVSKAKHDPSIPVIFEAQVLVDGYIKGQPFLIGEMLLLCFKTHQGYRFDQVPMQADLQTIFSRHRIEAEHVFAAVASDHGAGVLVTTPIDDGPKILVNRQSVREASVPLFARDVIEIENIRIELYEPGEKSLKCSNPSCQLLNPYVLNGNCRFCSFGLVGAVTRVAVAPSKPNK
jgi:pSer/pThr/pTyr-binding forkhead associated (FHA) protein